MGSTVITIDGPAGSGKSSASRHLAARLGAVYLDSGATYRAATLAAMRRGVDLEDEQALAQMVDNLSITFKGDPLRQQVFLDGEDVSADIRTPEVTRNIHHVARASEVRTRMRALQQQIARSARCAVAEGRDMSTVVFPESPCKVYLDAAPRERARRRWLEMGGPEAEQSLDDVLEDLVRRDETDYNRKDGPLVRAEDARVLDTTGMTLEQVVDHLERMVRSVLPGDAPCGGAP